MKTNKSKLFALSALALLSLSSCGGSSSGVTRVLFEDDFKSGKTFTTFADLPPNPTSDGDLSDYKALGFNTCVLTEDSVSMVGEDGHLSDDYKQAIRNIGDKGMKCYIRNMYNDPDYFVCDAEGAAKSRSNYGSPYSLSERNITDEFSEFDDIITGFFQGDEIYKSPNTCVEWGDVLESAPYRYWSIDDFAKIVAWQNQYYPSKNFFMNHVPSSSKNHWKMGDTYRSFIDYYIDNIIDKLTGTGDKVVSLDNYPLRSGNFASNKETYLTDLLTVAQATKDYNDKPTTTKPATFGFYVGLHDYAGSGATTDDTSRRPTSPEEITYQLYSGLSMGAKSLEYFCYRSLSGQVDGVINVDGSKSDVYDYLKTANERVLPMQDVLLGFDWQNFAPVSADEETNRENATCFDNLLSMVDTSNLGSLDYAATSSRLDAAIGYFTKEVNGKTRDGYLISNQTVTYKGESNTVFLTFKDCDQALIYHEGKASYSKLLNHQIRLTLDPGDAYFVIPA